MIKIIVGPKLPIKHANVVVLTANFMHGDADQYTQDEWTAGFNDQERLLLLKRVADAYAQSGRRFGDLADNFSFLAGAVEESDVDVVDEFFPWDRTQADFGMYENRAHLESWSLTYYGSLGVPHKVVLEES